MSCSNCYNGCAEIVSDKCVRYTGINVPVLGIQTGDSLSYIEQALIEFLTSTLNGVGILPVIDPTIVCEIVTANLPTCGELTLNDYISTLIKVACDLQDQVTALEAIITDLESNYTVDCLEGVSAGSGTHDILQAVINKLCALEIDLTALALDLDTNYVKISELDTLIQAYLDSISGGAQQYLKMVPYTVVEYYGNLTNYPTVSDGFGGTGIGYGAWENVYLCNGLNGTPDKRGRVPVGVTNGMGGGAFSPSVNPAVAGNPTYTIGSTAGANTVILTSAQIPGHTHTATASITDPGHRHDILGITGGDNDDMSNTVRFAGGDKTQSDTSFFFTNTQACQTSTTGISTVVTVANNTGGGGAHANNQPALACYYIMYIP